MAKSLKTVPGRVARFDYVQRWILQNIATTNDLRVSGNVARAYFRPGEVGNPEGQTTIEAVRAWAQANQLQVWYVERTDTFHFMK